MSDSGFYEIKNVKLNSPAYDAGLNVEELILKVNNVVIVNQSIEDLIDLIKDGFRSNSLKMVVIEKNHLDSHLNETMEIGNFKRCTMTIVPGQESFGFSLSDSKDPKHTIFAVLPNSPAFKANLRKNDVVIEINGVNIRRRKFEQLKELIEESSEEGNLEILAIDEKGYYYYKDRNIRFSKIGSYFSNENIIDFHSDSTSTNNFQMDDSL